MKRWLGLLLLCGGCGTAPLADFMDHFMPAGFKPGSTGAPGRGGVCDPVPGGPGQPPSVADTGLVPRLAAPPGTMPPPPDLPMLRPQ